ncbi:hypothetical protein NEOLEDRAFT_554610 [Neolentinus lepideus HHB14362 ss-1]|uniref:Uncharacterized protein n=1 Tax=Neolentinus lepideus HHB14362 ss-1 TaxID=1314782 RepID=A0A165R4Y2_9AGAM|nr:hypothetical protein NEOLEDRAFT_554610 [Neolentinus lepideus HHB14362 ss-1]
MESRTKVVRQFVLMRLLFSDNMLHSCFTLLLRQHESLCLTTLRAEVVSGLSDPVRTSYRSSHPAALFRLERSSPSRRYESGHHCSNLHPSLHQWRLESTTCHHHAHLLFTLCFRLVLAAHDSDATSTQWTRDE